MTGSKVKMPEELRILLRRYRPAFLTVALLSAILNILTLGGSLYMMLVYDSVLPSHSLPSLFGLLALLIGVYAFQGVFDLMRSRILGDVANSMDGALTRRVHRAMSDRAMANGASSTEALTPMRDLENVRTFLSGSGPSTLMDLPWILFFVAVLMMVHVWTGLTALIGGAILVGLTLVTDRVTRNPTARMTALHAYRSAQADSNVRHAETLYALGMRERMLDRWQAVNGHYLAAQNGMARSVGTLAEMSKMGRLLLQSLILTVGAILVISGKASGGVIFASSILSARALAPVDSAIANWRSLAAARLGWQRLCELLMQVPATPTMSTILPAPKENLTVEGLFVAAPGAQRLTVQGADFALKAGDALAVIGPSAAGKSSLARALIGIWRPARGTIRLDGATIDQWPADLLGKSLGYLPQTVELLDGTVAENIARFDPDATSEAVIAAAQSAGVHELILGLPQGYETQVGFDGGRLSGGQQQRVALARALYGNPFLVLLDEPNSNLDSEGDQALVRAISGVKARGGIVIIISHRPSVLVDVNLALFLRNGRVEAFGPRDEVMHRVLGRPVAVPSGPAPAFERVARVAAAGGF